MLWFLLACTSSDPVRTPTDDTDVDTDIEDTDVEDTDVFWETCHGVPGDADRTRNVVANFPFDGDGDGWGVFTLSASGALVDAGTRFSMRKGADREIAFTPDGEIGIAVHDDGTLGVFRFDAEDGELEVIHPGFGNGMFYAEDVVIHPDGEQVFVVDNNWRNNGGGIYTLALACDGTLSFTGQLFTAKQPKGLQLAANGGVGLVFARDFEDVKQGDNLHLVDLELEERIASGPVFPDDEAIASATLWTADGTLGLVGDNAGFSSIPNRIGVARIDGDTITSVQSIEVEDPYALVESPFDGSVLVVSGFGDALFWMERSGDGFEDPAELPYINGRPELPGATTTVTRGALAGHVLIAEVSGIRQLQFETAGAITDWGRLTTGGVEGIVGSIGVQP